MSVSIKEALDLHRGEPSWTKSLGVNVNAFELAALLERCEKMEAQLEAVKRLAKAHVAHAESVEDEHANENGSVLARKWSGAAWLKTKQELDSAEFACLAVGIDPKEL